MNSSNKTFQSLILVFIVLFAASPVAQSQLPPAREIAAQLKVGWNLGNTLEAICAEDAWGSAITSQALIDLVKASGFNAVRIPCSWDCHTLDDGTIDPVWMARVQAVVDYCINVDLYVILNIHWDGGWLENNCTPESQDEVIVKMELYWTQIATHFRDYDEHLLFAGANEPNVEDETGMAVLLSYHQTFVDAVRRTGGNNASRTLIIQGPSTDIDHTYNLMHSLPEDSIADRLMVEVHYYTPSQYCILSEDAAWGKMFYYWGENYRSKTDTGRNATWGEEQVLDQKFRLMKSKFVDNGIPVIIGEFSAARRELDCPSDQALHDASRRHFYHYLVKSAVSRGIIPFCWDIDKGLFDGRTAAVVDPEILDAIMEAVEGADVE